MPQNPEYEGIGYRPVASAEPGELEAPAGSLDKAEGTSAGREAVARAVEILLRGHDFKWHVTYPGRDGKLRTDDDVHGQRNLLVPAHSAIDVHVESGDYIYTVHLPGFAVREIAVPELTHHLCFRTTEAGTSPLEGDQLCGWAHSDLLGEVVVLPRRDFLAWCDRLAASNDLVPAGSH